MVRSVSSFGLNHFVNHPIVSMIPGHKSNYYVGLTFTVHLVGLKEGLISEMANRNKRFLDISKHLFSMYIYRFYL